MMEIQQHDDVVVDATVFLQDFAKRCGRRERCNGREREAPGARVRLPSLPPLYIGVQGGAGPRRSNLLGGRRPRVGGTCPPRHVGHPHPQGSQP